MTAHASTASIPAPAAARAALLGRLTATRSDVAPLVARVALGAVMFPHGAQKGARLVRGLWALGDDGLFHRAARRSGVVRGAGNRRRVPGIDGLLAGALSRVAAVGVASVMAVAVLMVHAKVGFFMNWYGTQQGEGFEYHLLALGLALIVILKGGGAYAVDRWIVRRAS